MSLKLEKKRKRKAGAGIEQKDAAKRTASGNETGATASPPPPVAKPAPAPRRPVPGPLRRGSILRPQADPTTQRSALRAQIETCNNVEYAASVTAQVEAQAAMQANVRGIMEAAQRVSEFDRHLRDKFPRFSDTYHRDNQRKNRMKLVGTLSLNSGELVPVYARMGTHDNTQLMLEPLTAALRMSGRIVKPGDQALCLFSDSGGLPLPRPATLGPPTEVVVEKAEKAAEVPREQETNQIGI